MNLTCVAISAYSGDLHQVENNLPCYLHHKHPVVVLSPKDAPILSVSEKKVKCLTAGQKGWIGPQTLQRQQEFLRLLHEQREDFFLFNDADSVCLSPQIPDYVYRNQEVFWSNEVLDTNPARSKLPKIAMQPPYFFSRNVLRKLIRSSVTPAQSYMEPSPQGWPMPIPTVCIDHWMLQVVYSGRIQHRSFPDGASFETTSDHGFQTMREHVGRLGKVFIHQVKTKPVLDALLIDRRHFLGK